MICELTRHSQTTSVNCLNQSMKTFIILFAALKARTENEASLDLIDSSGDVKNP